MVAYSKGGGENDMAESTGREDVLHPLLDVLNGNVESRRDDTTLVDAAIQGDYDFASAVVV